MTAASGVISGASVSHQHATVDEIERAAARDQASAVERLLSVPAVEEAYVLQTCNRIEAYVVTGDEPDGRATLETFFADVADDVLVELGHEASLRHLMRVAAGLESLVLGEDQILGQVRTAFETAREVGGIGPVLEEGVTKAIHVGERARTETEINEGSVSLASAAVRLADEEVGVDGEEALVVGTGEMGRLAAENLAERAAHLYVANRSPEGARRVADALTAETTALGLDDVEDALAEARVVVTATGSDGFLFGRETFSGIDETFVVDIAQPRDVPHEATEWPGVTVRDLDALKTVTSENRRQRERAAATVEEMIDAEFERLLAQYKRKRADRVISAMYESAERVKARELETAFEKLDGFDEDQRAVVEAMADAIVNQLLAAPTKSLRDAAEEDDWSTINTALQLFDPEFDPDDASIASEEATGPAEPDGPADPEEIPEGVREQIPNAVLDRLSDD